MDSLKCREERGRKPYGVNENALFDMHQKRALKHMKTEIVLRQKETYETHSRAHQAPELASNGKRYEAVDAANGR